MCEDGRNEEGAECPIGSQWADGRGLGREGQRTEFKLQARRRWLAMQSRMTIEFRNAGVWRKPQTDNAEHEGRSEQGSRNNNNKLVKHSDPFVRASR